MTVFITLFSFRGLNFSTLSTSCGRRSKSYVSKTDDFFVNLCQSHMGITFTSAHPLFSRFSSDVSANIAFHDFLALFFCSNTMIYNENAMIFSALPVVISFFQRLSCDIANFTFFSTKNEEIHSFLKAFLRLRWLLFLAITMNDL